MRTTVTLESEELDRLVKVTGLRTKAKAVTYAVKQALRLKKIEDLEKLRGKTSLDRRVLRWRHLDR
jgi:Arc/MetJ family transcription regulator